MLYPMRTQTIQTTCDLCGFSTDDARVFTACGTLDLCRWCMSGPVTETSCGGHTIVVTGDAWTCDCGETMDDLRVKLLTNGVSIFAMKAAPNLPSATAAIHVQTPNWPRSY